MPGSTAATSAPCRTSSSCGRRASSRSCTAVTPPATAAATRSARSRPSRPHSDCVRHQIDRQVQRPSIMLEPRPAPPRSPGSTGARASSKATAKMPGPAAPLGGRARRPWCSRSPSPQWPRLAVARPRRRTRPSAPEGAATTGHAGQHRVAVGDPDHRPPSVTRSTGPLTRRPPRRCARPGAVAAASGGLDAGGRDSTPGRRRRAGQRHDLRGVAAHHGRSQLATSSPRQCRSAPAAPRRPPGRAPTAYPPAAAAAATCIARAVPSCSVPRLTSTPQATPANGAGLARDCRPWPARRPRRAARWRSILPPRCWSGTGPVASAPEGGCRASAVKVTRSVVVALTVMGDIPSLSPS